MAAGGTADQVQIPPLRARVMGVGGEHWGETGGVGQAQKPVTVGGAGEDPGGAVFVEAGVVVGGEGGGDCGRPPASPGICPLSHATLGLISEVLYLHEYVMRAEAVSYTHLRAHETVLDLVCRLLLEKKKKKNTIYNIYLY